MKLNKRSKSGQGMVEYIIIVVIIALAAIAVFGVFGDRLRTLVGGAAAELGADSGDVDSAISTSSEDMFRSVDETGIN